MDPKPPVAINASPSIGLATTPARADLPSHPVTATASEAPSSDKPVVGALETIVPIPLGKLPIVEAITQRSRSSIYADVKAGTFPRPIRIGRRSVAWDLNSVYQWVADRSRECDER